MSPLVTVIVFSPPTGAPSLTAIVVTRGGGGAGAVVVVGTVAGAVVAAVVVAAAAVVFRPQKQEPGDHEGERREGESDALVAVHSGFKGAVRDPGG